jgi:hypothetical protein
MNFFIQYVYSKLMKILKDKLFKILLNCAYFNTLHESRNMTAVESEFVKSLALYFMYKRPVLNHATVLELLHVKPYN